MQYNEYYAREVEQIARDFQVENPDWSKEDLRYYTMEEFYDSLQQEYRWVEKHLTQFLDSHLQDDLKEVTNGNS